jgi:hypothetical protein
MAWMTGLFEEYCPTSAFESWVSQGVEDLNCYDGTAQKL